MFTALLIGAGVFLASLLFYGVATALLVELVVRLIRTGYTGSRFSKNVAIMMAVSVITAFVHLVQIAMWAVVFLIYGEISPFEKAFFFSAENYTALGYGDIIPSEKWRVLGPMEAINGLMLFGLSTALMFALMSHLIANRLRLKLAHLRGG